MTSLNDKKSLRAAALKTRDGIDAAHAQAASREVAKLLLQEIPLSANIVAGYWAIGRELNVSEAMTQLTARGHTLCLPSVTGEGQPLQFHGWRPGAQLKQGRFGMEVDGVAALIVPDAIIVPLVAFDGAGNRLGYGKGFYDQTIAGLRGAGKNVMIIGAAFAAQQISAIPSEPHDQKLDAVVTEKGVVRF